jgi:hypothetical protein
MEGLHRRREWGDCIVTDLKVVRFLGVDWINVVSDGQVNTVVYPFVEIS